ncbi:MAG TPA: hypothetical protein PKK33_07985, partial [Candidatus Cloacimonadota bacterium]|nr:hypothetical protein [Candidatus Cloacimonadota bacterium]
GNGPMPDETVKQLQQTSPESFISVIHDRDKFQISLGEDLTIDGIALKNLQFKNDDMQFQWLVDPVTFIPKYVIASETGENGPEIVRTKFIENKTIDGVLFSIKKETTDKDNKVVGTTEMSEIKTNVKLTDDFFAVK